MELREGRELFVLCFAAISALAGSALGRPQTVPAGFADGDFGLKGNVVGLPGRLVNGLAVPGRLADKLPANEAPALGLGGRRAGPADKGLAGIPRELGKASETLSVPDRPFRLSPLSFGDNDRLLASFLALACSRFAC